MLRARTSATSSGRALHGRPFPLLVAFVACLCTLGIGSASAFAGARIAVQPDGKILVAGEAGLGFGMLARLGPDGDLDPTFGKGGIVFDRTSTAFTDVAVQPDGKIVALNVWSRLKRFLPDGRPDLGFGKDGVAVRPPLAILDPPIAFTLLPDGRIAVGGNYQVKMTTHQALAFVYAADGKSAEQVGKIGPEQTYFTGEGNLAGSLTALAPWRDGTLLMAGYSAPDFHSSEGSRTVLARFVPGAGSRFDPGFGDGAGLVTVPYPGEKPAFNALAPVPGGVYAAGGVSRRLALARFSEEGALDTGFGSGGYAELASAPDLVQGNDLAVQADGRVVVAGEEVSWEGQTGRSCRGCRSPLLARFRPDGSLDPGFGDGGVTELTVADGAGVRARGEAVVGLPDGRLVVGGLATSRKPRVLLGMVGPDGALDRSFGDGGIVTVDACPGNLAAQRRAGCLPSARVDLRVRGVGRGIGLRLRVRPNVDWAVLTGLYLTLPKQLHAIRRRGREIETTLVEGNGDRRSARVGLTGRRLGGYWSIGLRSISLAVPAGVLREVEAASEGAKLPFRIEATFGSPLAYGRSSHLVVLRRALG